MPERALSGIRVLDLSGSVSGPYCTKMLADFGAEVLKVERPGTGDPARMVGPFRDDKPDPEGGGLFLYLNTNKKSITLDLGKAAAVDIVTQLVAETDILVESHAPGVMAGVGLGYDTLAQVNSRLVMISITGFGQTGPYRDYQASDLTIWGLSGILYELGEPDREPLKMGSQVSEYVAGLYGCLVSLAALYYRDQTGVGQHVDLSSWEAFHTMQPSMTIVYSYAGFIRKRAGIHFPWGILPCEDGYIGFYFPTQTHWELLCTLLGMPELVDKPEYETPMLREERRDEITAIIVTWLKGKRMNDVFHAAQELRLPLTIVPNVKQVLELEQHKTRGFFADTDHPVAGGLTYPGAPFKPAETPWQAGRAPLLGEHNDEVYRGRLSLSTNRIEELAREGVI